MKSLLILLKKLKQNDETASTIIHGLKGVSGNLGATALFTICQNWCKI